MDNFFDKIKNGAEKAKRYGEENRQAKNNASLALMLLNDGLPLVVIVAYLLMGLLGGLWHPGWIVFFAIPCYYATAECIKHKSAAMFPIPLYVTVVYLLMGFLGGLWHPGWAIFIVIPIYYALVSLIKSKSVTKLLDVLVPVITVAVYLLMGFLGGLWHPGWVVFFAVPIYYQVKATVKKYRKRTAKKNAAEINSSNSYINTDGEDQ